MNPHNVLNELEHCVPLQHRRTRTMQRCCDSRHHNVVHMIVHSSVHGHLTWIQQESFPHRRRASRRADSLRGRVPVDIVVDATLRASIRKLLCGRLCPATKRREVIEVGLAIVVCVPDRQRASACTQPEYDIASLYMVSVYCFVTKACARRPGAAASVECRRRER